MIRNLLLFFTCALFATLHASEGMWLPMLIEKQILSEMKTQGLKLEASDIYQVNEACLKDAVMLFGNGCTASFISDSGLILTNHHCCYSYIQDLSAAGKNYLEDGFWAMSREEEIPIPGLSVKVLQYMRDVSTEILNNVNDTMDMQTRRAKIQNNAKNLESRLSENGKYEVTTHPFYGGNQYFAFVSMEYNDVRWVGAPPSSIGNFGGETDNWMWPRHGGDFALFRVYANAKNEPSFYRKANQALSPKKSIPVSLKGINQNDFTFVYGYPGSTDLYAPSYYLKMLIEDTYPVRIGARALKLNVMHESIDRSEALRLKYANKAKKISNAQKQWQGEIEGVIKHSVIEKKITKEQAITEWINADTKLLSRYGNLFDEYKTLYEALTPLSIAGNQIYEMIYYNGMETVSFSDIFPPVSHLDSASARHYLNLYTPRIRKHYKNYDRETDKKLTLGLLQYYTEHIPGNYIADTLKLKKIQKKGLEKYVNEMFEQTYFSDSTKLYGLFSLPPKEIDKALASDPANILKKQLSNLYVNKVRKDIRKIKLKTDSLDRLLMMAMMEYDSTCIYTPDANSTLRISFGKTEGYEAKDGVYFMHNSTIEGIMEKENPNSYQYRVPQKLKSLYLQQDYGQYRNKDGTITVNFIASNHTTGGNSGSPVLDADGRLVGVNFDRAWDGIISDLYYLPQISRNISVDIRYVLFIIDKFAGAGYLLDEMNIVR